MRCKKIALVIQSRNYSFHKELALDFIKAAKSMQYEGFIVDMTDKKPLYEIFYYLKEIDADLIICFDMSGSELRTETDRLSLNQLPCRICHLLSESCSFYGEKLKETFNFSMFFYMLSQKECQLLEVNYPNVENVGWCFELVDYVAGNNEKTKEFLQRVLSETRLL